MVIGNGLIGTGFLNSKINHDNLIIFASGVSNSKETDVNRYAKEKELLLKTIKENKNLKFIYFSSILTGIMENTYYSHKLELEKIIIDNCENYLIFRVPQIIGFNGNKNNLLNSFIESIKTGSEIKICKDTYRALIDIKDLVSVVDYCVDKINNQIIKFSSIQKISVDKLVSDISKLINKKAKTKTIICTCDNNWFDSNSQIISDAISFLKLNDYDYTNKIIKKYIKN
jgi:UDP-2-acetamido-2,6-beta-L-arabino-hexul-4-ose reductase